MAKDPAFLFYPGDWDGGTKLFSRAQKGAYMDLLIAQFNCGRMTSQDIRHILGRDYDSMWILKLKSKFKKDKDGKFYNERLEIEQSKRKNFTESRKSNLLGFNQYSHKGGHTSKRMENENKDRNKDNKNREKSFCRYCNHPHPEGTECVKL
jgi:hypothetical protein